MINKIKWLLAVPFLVLAFFFAFLLFIFGAIAFCITHDHKEQTLGEWFDTHFWNKPF